MSSTSKQDYSIIAAFREFIRIILVSLQERTVRFDKEEEGGEVDVIKRKQNWWRRRRRRQLKQPFAKDEEEEVEQIPPVNYHFLFSTFWFSPLYLPLFVCDFIPHLLPLTLSLISLPLLFVLDRPSSQTS